MPTDANDPGSVFRIPFILAPSAHNRSWLITCRHTSCDLNQRQIAKGAFTATERTVTDFNGTKKLSVMGFISLLN
jgi:hypothetical protein